MAFRVAKKRCRDCGRVRPVSYFYVKEARRHSTRYFSRCKECYAAFIRRPGRRAPRTIGTKRVLSDQERDVRFKAWAAVNNAVYKGRVSKPLRCSWCLRKKPSMMIHGHHPDHSHKMSVVWLCDGCHRKETP